MLYVLESGQMKIISTTGALLSEKNIGYEVSQTGHIESELVTAISGPNPEDMWIAVLTKKGKVLKYALKLEKSFDDGAILRSVIESEEAPNDT